MLATWRELECRGLAEDECITICKLDSFSRNNIIYPERRSFHEQNMIVITFKKCNAILIIVSMSINFEENFFGKDEASEELTFPEEYLTISAKT